MNLWQWYRLFRGYGNRRVASVCKAITITGGASVRVKPDAETGQTAEQILRPNVIDLEPGLKRIIEK